MTVFVDTNGSLHALGIDSYGGFEEYKAKVEGKDPPVNLYRPRIGNVAPRIDGWKPVRSNTQTPPLSGPDKNKKPMAQQPRGPLFPFEFTKSAQ